MSVTEMNSARRVGQLVLAVGELLQAAYVWVLIAYRARQTRRALDRLDERMLRDIGLSRGENGYKALPDQLPHAGRRGRRRR